MLDFNISSYFSFLETLIKKGFSFQTFEEFVTNPKQKVVVLRHDVDKFPKNAEGFAEIEAASGIMASYHFRFAKESNNVGCIKKIVQIGHELGYHYERQQATGDRRQGLKNEIDLLEMDFSTFKKNLEYFRQFYPVKVISMHGNPLSMFDNRKLWKYYDYRELGIICEPYFDINHSDILYLTDTGRRWNGDKYNVRDKASKGKTFFSISLPQNSYSFQDWVMNPIPGSLMNMTPESETFQKKFSFKSTSDLIHAASNNELPDKIVINTHPQRWTDKPIPWVKELVWQNVKNVGKYFLLKMRD